MSEYDKTVYLELLEEMRGRYQEESGVSPDDASDIGIRIKVLAEQLAVLYGAVEELGRQVFPQTSDGEYLLRHAEARGMGRKPATGAKGRVVFSRETAAYTDLPIPVGTTVATATEPKVYYITAEAAVLPAGQREVEVPAEAVTLGKGGNAAAGTICLMVQPAQGISSVTNRAPFTGGSDEESDEMLRRRLLHCYANPSNGANAAYYYDIAMGVQGVSFAAVLPRKRGRGTVDVLVCTASPEQEAAILAELKTLFSRQREVGVDVAVRAPVVDKVALTAKIAVAVEYNYQMVAAEAEERLREYIGNLEIGAPLPLAVLGKVLLEVPGIENCRLEAPATDFATLSDHVARPGTISLASL